MIPYIEFLSGLPRRPAVVAHRGAWRFGPENSIPAVLAAADLGCEIAEIDVQLSTDGHLFLLHDDDLARMTGHSAIAQNLTIAQIAGRPLKSDRGGANAGFSDTTLPPFAALLAAAHGRIYLDVDVKHDRNLPIAAAAIAAAGMADQAAIKARVQNARQADQLRKLQDEHGLMVMPKTSFTEDSADVLLDLLTQLGARVCEIEFNRLDTIARRHDAFAKAGIALWVNTLNGSHCDGFADNMALADPDKIWGALARAGISIIQTDYPEAFLEWRQTRSQSKSHQS